jgi:sec-independent protein translocase protein TatC
VGGESRRRFREVNAIVSKPDRKDDPKEMSFIEHLDELRKVLVQSVLVFTGFMVVCWFLSGRILDILVRPIPVDTLYFQAPTEAFMVRVNISLVVGFMASFPFILFRVWAFVSPALFAHERKKVLPFIVASSSLFYTGVVFCYLMLIPIVLRFLLSYGTKYVNPLISVNLYFGFVARLCFAFGIVFQLPIVVLLLTIIGIVTPQWLLRQWRYAIVFIFVASAVLTPPDALSMIAMALPVLALYAASVVIAFVVVRRKPREG